MNFKLKLNFLILSIISTSLFFSSCKEETKYKEMEVKEETAQVQETKPFFKLSLAQWSIHKEIMDNGMDPFDFAKVSKEWGFEGLEYVSQLYSRELQKYDDLETAMDSLVAKLKMQSEAHGMKNLLIMVDEEGDLADSDEAARNKAVENHKKWVDAAAALGCHSIRVNTFGTNDPDEWRMTCADGLKKLSEYAATKNINVLVENHGWLSSEPHLVMEVINGLDMDNCGTLPDFGNWCIKRKDGANWGECVEVYKDKYEGIETLMPAAKAVSAKSYDFNEEGDETTIDYYRMIKIVKDAGYDGYIGVEYEGNRLSEEEGILATKQLLLKAASKLK